MTLHYIIFFLVFLKFITTMIKDEPEHADDQDEKRQAHSINTADDQSKWTLGVHYSL
jgi:hypothetical protein